MGDTIDRFSGPLEDLVWVQYAALQHDDLFGKENHEEFERQLRDSARKLDLRSDKAPELESHAHYPSQRVHYPTAAELTRPRTVPAPEPEPEPRRSRSPSQASRTQKASAAEVANLQFWEDLEVKTKDIEELGVAVHPRATHLLFFDTSGTQSNLYSRGCE